MEWQRPDCIHYPKVWHKFERLNEINKQKLQFWIQDITEDLYESALQIMRTGFINEIILGKVLKVGEDLEAVEEMSQVYRRLISNKLSCVCMTNDDNGKPIPVAVVLLKRVSIDDAPFYPVSKTYSRICSIIQYAYHVSNIFEHLNVTEYLGENGVYVLPKYRKQGICIEILKCWTLIANAMGFKAGAGTCIAPIPVQATKSAGFSELVSLEYDKLKDNNPLFDLPGIEEYSKYLTIMYKVF